MTGSFNYYSPTKVVFGKNTENQVGKLLKEFGASKVLVHFGTGSAKRSGLLDRVYKCLDEENIPYISLGGVVPNPRLSLAREGIELCRREGVDFILAVGGGSVIDSAKCIGYGLANPEDDVWDFYQGKKKAKACTPNGCILTLAATGSELSDSSVITNEDGNLKRGYCSDYSRCRFAILNPELTYTLPAYQTACGAVDIMMHTMERYFQNEGAFCLSEGFAEVLLRNILFYTPIAMATPDNYKARAEIMWSGSLSHNGLMELGGTHGDWSCHQMEHELSGKYDVAHGAGLAAIWGSWARHVYKYNVKRFVRFASYVMGVCAEGSNDDIALKGIRAFEVFLQSIGMPTSLSELGISPSDEDIRDMAAKCSREGRRTIGDTGIKALGFEDMESILLAAR